MKRYWPWLLGSCLLLVICAPASWAQGETYTLAENGVSDWHIISSKFASPSEVHAASELQSYLQQISGATLPIVQFDAFGAEPPLFPHEIIVGWARSVGDNSRVQRLLQEHNIKINFSELGAEGFVIRAVGPHIIIVGGRTRGTLYGVYTFLEDYFGCRWFDSTISVIPRQRTPTVEAMNVIQKPAFRLRDIMIGEFRYDANLAVCNKVNGQVPTSDTHGGKFGWANPVNHTFSFLLPSNQFFAEHPEYYALVNGKRQTSQLCLTNPDVLRIATERVQKWMRDNPSMEVFDVSQNDGVGYCTCEHCAALDEREGSQQGTILTFVNAIADAVRDEFPNKYICTFAYAYSQTPPKTLRPAQNVIIRLCSFFDAPMWMHDPAKEGWQGDFPDVTRQWAQITENIFLWDYARELCHVYMPLPNLQKLSVDMQGLQQSGVTGYYAQTTTHGPHGGLQALRGYLLAKLAWNPAYDTEKGTDEFLAACYGKAAPAIRAYIDLMHQHLPKSLADREKKPYDAPFTNSWMGASPTRWWLTPELLNQYDALFIEAEQLVQHDPAALLRVKIARLEPQYALIRTLPNEDPRRAQIIEQFFATVNRAGILEIGYYIIPGVRHCLTTDFKAYLDKGGQ